MHLTKIKTHKKNKSIGPHNKSEVHSILDRQGDGAFVLRKIQLLNKTLKTFNLKI